jgi:hypothetical protein
LAPSHVEEAVAAGEMSIDFPPNALAALLLAISDGLVLHYALDPHAFRWGKISKAVDGMLEGFATSIAPGRIVEGKPASLGRRQPCGHPTDGAPG